MLDPELADIDGDGDLDLLVVGDVTRLFLNDGLGTHTEAPGMLPSSEGAARMATGDVDGDGDTDVVLATIHIDMLLSNDGAGNLAPSTGLPALDEKTGFAELEDVDGDGDLDYLAIGGRYLLFEGNGAGAFAPPEMIGEGKAFDPALIDLEHDGDLDILAAQDLTVRTWLHVGGGQTSRRTPPRVGKRQRMEVYGAIGTPWILAAAPIPASIAIPPFGTLELDPSTLTVVGRGLVPTSGVAAVDVDIPDLASLVGQTVHWQAAVGAPIRLVNREPTTLTDF